jgi:adenylate cyclase class 2
VTTTSTPRTAHSPPPGTNCASAPSTYKAPAVDQASGSKPEYETNVTDPEATTAILHGLGYRTLIAFTKNCRNYRLRHQSRELLATVVTVPEIEGTFIELETIVRTEEGLAAALAAVRTILADLGVENTDLTDELYTDAVAKALAAVAED